MGLCLAFKRVGRLYRPTPRPWLRKNLGSIALYVTGIYTGVLIAPHGNLRSVNDAFIVTMIALIILRWWAEREPITREAASGVQTAEVNR